MIADAGRRHILSPDRDRNATDAARLVIVDMPVLDIQRPSVAQGIKETGTSEESGLGADAFETARSAADLEIWRDKVRAEIGEQPLAGSCHVAAVEEALKAIPKFGGVGG